MIKIPYEEVVLKINEKTNIPLTEIEERVEKKLRQLSGLISKEGAAHIIANELGVKILEQLSGRLQIKNILTGLRDIEIIGKVLEVGTVREFSNETRSGKFASILIGDETGIIKVLMWGSQAENIQNIYQGCTVKLIGAYSRDNNGKKEIHLNERAQIIINPKDEIIKEVISQRITIRKNIQDLSENDDSAELLGTLVQVFELKFYETCLKCGKRIKPIENVFVCKDHGNLDNSLLSYAYVLNIILDDGTGTIRCVFFRNQVESITDMNQEQILKFRDEPSSFESVKNKLEGSFVKLKGKVNKNLLFNRIELVVDSVDINPSPEEELKRLEC